MTHNVDPGRPKGQHRGGMPRFNPVALSGRALICQVLQGCHRFEMPSGEALENVSFTCENAGLDFGRWRVLTSF